MDLVVVDASALVEYLLGTPRANRVAAVIEDPDSDLHAPALADVEVVSVLRQGILAGRLELHRAETALEDYLDLPLTRHGHQASLSRILELHANFTPYDAAYMTLAAQLGAELVTGDRRLGRAVQQQLDLAVTVVA